MPFSWLHRLPVVLSACLAAAVVWSARQAGSPGPGFASVSLALLFGVAATAAYAWYSLNKNRTAATIEDAGWPSLQSMARASFFLVLIQVVLGAAYRHQMIGLMAHAVGALLVAIVVLIAAVSILTITAAQRSLTRTAAVLTASALVQVILGIGAYVAREGTLEGNGWVTALAPAHAGVGSVTLAVSLILWLEVRRNVRRPGSAADAGVEPLQVAR